MTVTFFDHFWLCCSNAPHISLQELNCLTAVVLVIYAIKKPGQQLLLAYIGLLKFSFCFHRHFGILISLNEKQN